MHGIQLSILVLLVVGTFADKFAKTNVQTLSATLLNGEAKKAGNALAYSDPV
jgi:hypothetical protein